MSMTRDQMLRYIDDPSLLNERTQGELREILDEYPYFQTAHLLYIRNLQLENNFRYQGQLKMAAAYATDRTVLFHLLNPKQPKGALNTYDSLEIKSESVAHQTPLMELTDHEQSRADEQAPYVESFSTPAEVEHFDLLNFELSDSSYMLEKNEVIEELSNLSEPGEAVTPDGSKKRKGKKAEQKDVLIDRFINENPAFTVRQFENSETAASLEAQSEGLSEKDEFITETLARIYMNQGLYQKAINAFEKLSLKYPEKSAYFARQIEEITNLLNK